MSCSNANPRGAVPNPALDIAEQLKLVDLRARAVQIKRKLEAIAEQLLPASMGRAYTDVVLACLRCLDPGNDGFGDESEFKDLDGLSVGVRYIEKVRKHRCSFISLSNPCQVLYVIEDIKFNPG